MDALIGTDALNVLWTAAHFTALFSAFLARPCQSSESVVCRTAFLGVCMMVVTVAAAIGSVRCADGWPLSATTLGAMVVFAVADVKCEGQ